MPDWDDVRRLAAALPETDETVSRGHLFWRVQGRGFVWERPLRRPDLAALGADAPSGPLLGAPVDDEATKQATLAGDPDVFFTIPHFDGYAAVLVRLERIALPRLGEVVTDAWLAMASPTLAQEWVGEHGG
jgi:hypothetical protein